MATRVVPTSLDADNSAGSFTLAACNDWRSEVRRFHVGTGHHEPTSDAGYTTAGSPYLPQLSISPLPLRGESIYAGLGGAAIDLAPMPHFDDFNRALGVIDHIDHSILALANSKKRGVSGELFTTRWPRLRGKGLNAANNLLAVSAGSDRLDFLRGGRADQQPIFGHVFSNRGPMIRRKCCARSYVDQKQRGLRHLRPMPPSPRR